MPIKDFSILRPQLKVIFSGFMPGCSLFSPWALFHCLFLDAGTSGGKRGKVVRAFCYTPAPTPTKQAAASTAPEADPRPASSNAAAWREQFGHRSFESWFSQASPERS